MTVAALDQPTQKKRSRVQKIRDNSLQNLYTSIPRTGLEPVSVEGMKKDCSKLAFEAGKIYRL